ncbi:DUF1835 domain-containing protein [Pontimicrobium aquaticum]|uniref:DUF1835 domain-containing protein n=1 Tax=Pontimicrobium aquaticum TaxID=2565367 RepID=A0A4U0ESN6_9FLAO|nr:DUF1835 domain-containing protein [Pontimicrobium aquaticum]TJY33342.1 DUF1835 domain-containing protein [Pontimicrobium aquaticum]
MTSKTLHITNGSSLTNYLKDLNFSGDFLTWHEMLCEGPTFEQIDSQEFVETRRSFLNKFYNIDIHEYQFHKELKVFDNVNTYSKIILWFEYDLFCHINLMAAISLLKQKQVYLPLFLVCSGRIKGEKDFKGISELTENQLLDHYEAKIELKDSDIKLAQKIWRIYCNENHNLLKPFITQSSSFKYLNSCLKAHLKRFPDTKSGLCRLEKHILEVVRDSHVTSTHHLTGYILNYQGYYGYGDIQIMRMIHNLSIFFEEIDGELYLNRKGHEALLGQHNFVSEIKNDIDFGGAKRLEYQFNKNQNQLIKTVYNVN